MNPSRLDPELEQVLRDTDLLEVAALLSSYAPPDPPLDPAFRTQLRRDLMRQAWDTLGRRDPWWRRLVGPRLAWAGATAGMAMLAIAAITLTMTGGGAPGVVFQLDHAQSVAVVEPIRVDFNQPMDHASVERSLQIQPATEVNFTWQGNTLLVQPKSGTLAPNTQYKVTLAPTARTASGAVLPASHTYVFVTRPLPSPSPSVAPSPSPATGLGIPVEVAATGPGAPAGWSADGSTLYFIGAGGRLQAITMATGASTSLADSAIAVAPAPDGKLVAYTTASGLWVVRADGQRARQVAAGSVTAIGWQGSRLVYLSGQDVLTADLGGEKAASTAPALAVAASKPTAAAFDPAASNLVYLDAAGGVHVLALAAGRDQAWTAPAAGLPVWAPGGARLAFAGAGGILTAPPAGSPATAIASLSDLGVSDPATVRVSWSAGDRLLIAAGGPLFVGDAFTTGVRPLPSGEYSGAAWTPDGSSIAYVRDGVLYTAALAPQTGAGAGDALQSATGVAGAFMDARVAGDAKQAGGYLDLAGQAAYAAGGGAPSLLAPDPGMKISRYFVVLAQLTRQNPATARVQVRIVESRAGLEVSQYDEILTLRQSDAGRFLVHDATRTPARPVDGGPEVLAVQVSPTAVQVVFDSDLQPASATAAVLLRGADGKVVEASAAYADRVVTLTLDQPLDPGVTYRLSVLTSVLDVAGKAPSAQYDLPVTGVVAALPAPAPSPSPAPTPS